MTSPQLGTTLFPYTTLFRSMPTLGLALLLAGTSLAATKSSSSTSKADCYSAAALQLSIDNAQCSGRSEEHTSELQSHVNLVCRLLTEKKNNRYQRGKNKEFS